MYYLLLTTTLHAKELYFYDSNEIAPLSQTFIDAQSQLFPKYESMERQITKYEVGISKMETMMLISDNEDGNLYEKFMIEKKHFVEDKLLFQKRAERTITGYGDVFMTAVQKEVQSNWNGAVECSEKQSLIMGMQLNKDTEECQGQNISTELARAIDKSTTLKNEIEKVNLEPWPNVTLPNLQQKLNGDFVHLSLLAEYFYAEELDYDRKLRNQEIGNLTAKLQSNDDTVKKEAIKQAEDIHKQYRDSLVEYGTQINLALEKIGASDIQICYTPKTFGGCTGVNKDNEMISNLENNRKAKKIIKKKKN